MSTNPKAPGGSNEGSGGTNEQETQTTESEKPSTVSRDAYEKAVTEAKKAKERAQALEAEAKKREEAELEKNQEFKKLAESYKKESDEWKGKFEGLNTNILESRKLHALQGKLSGKLPQEYWSLVDLEQIVHDPDTGKVDEASVARYAKEFEKKHSRLIDKQSAGRLPHEAAGGASKDIGFEAEIKAAKTQKEYEAVMRRHSLID